MPRDFYSWANFVRACLFDILYYELLWQYVLPNAYACRTLTPLTTQLQSLWSCSKLAITARLRSAVTLAAPQCLTSREFWPWHVWICVLTAIVCVITLLDLKTLAIIISHWSPSLSIDCCWVCNLYTKHDPVQQYAYARFQPNNCSWQALHTCIEEPWVRST